jgi:Flp pilus assembly pilin Flp
MTRKAPKHEPVDRPQRHHVGEVSFVCLGLLVGPHHGSSREDGQALIEYALIVSLIAIVAIVALRTTGNNISGILHTIAGEV